MKNWLVSALAGVMIAGTVGWAEAKRVGGGKSIGMQRSAPTQAAPQNTPASPANPSAAPGQAATPASAAAPAMGGAAAAAAAPAKRSWMGPIAGLAAGLGLAALMSHLGLGEAFANFLMMALLAVALFFVIRLVMRRFAGGTQREALATAGAGAGGTASGAAASWPPAQRSAEPVTPLAPAAPVTERSALAPSAGEVSVTGQPLRPLGDAGSAPAAMPSAAAVASVQATAPELPEGFDVPAFERIAKMIFIRLQAANDAGDLEDLRRFTTPEMFAELRIDLQDRAGAGQHTDVERVEARIVDFATEEGRQIVSVRFQGRIREDAESVDFDEVWHLSKPEGEGSQWAIAGIQQAN